MSIALEVRGRALCRAREDTLGWNEQRPSPLVCTVQAIDGITERLCEGRGTMWQDGGLGGVKSNLAWHVVV